MKSDSPRPGVLPPQTPAQKRACEALELVMDQEGRTAILLSGDAKEVKFIPMAAEGLFVTYTSPSVFRTRFPLSQRSPKAPRALQAASASAAARCYVTHATFCGADQAAVEALESLVPITKTEKEKIMSAKKKTEPKAEATKKTSAKKTATPNKAPTKGGAKAPKPAGEKRASASATFRELIMKGNLTDDQIFAEVQKRHPDVTPDKRSYVAWYRNDLRKRGENPPAPKKALKDKAA